MHQGKGTWDVALAPAAAGLASPRATQTLPKALMGLSEVREPTGGLTAAQGECQLEQFGVHRLPSYCSVTASPLVAS